MSKHSIHTYQTKNWTDSKLLFIEKAEYKYSLTHIRWVLGFRE